MYVDVDFAAIDDYEVAMFINNTRASIKKNYVKCNETRLGKTRGCYSLGNDMTLQTKNQLWARKRRQPSYCFKYNQ